MADPVLLDVQGRVEVTLGASVATGDLLGYSGGAWVKADADASPPIPGRLIALTAGAAGDRINACKRSIVEDADLNLTVDGPVYLAGTAGGVTQTAPAAAAAVVQVVGRALSATRYEVDLASAQPTRYIRQIVTFPVVIPTGTSAVDLVTSFTPGFRGRIDSWAFVTTVAGAGSGATRTPNLEINTTDVTGSNSVALALADTAALGQVKTLGAPTALNEFDADDTLSVELAAGGTQFTTLEGYFLVVLRAEVQHN